MLYCEICRVDCRSAKKWSDHHASLQHRTNTNIYFAGNYHLQPIDLSSEDVHFLSEGHSDLLEQISLVKARIVLSTLSERANSVVVTPTVESADEVVSSTPKRKKTQKKKIESSNESDGEESPKQKKRKKKSKKSKKVEKTETDSSE